MKTHYKLGHIKNIASALDREISIINIAIEGSSAPDSSGLLDQLEDLNGIGFVVCQTFLTSAHQGKNKSQAFSIGPFHVGGKSYARITNACANYWKHKDEWDRASISGQAKVTIDVIKSLGVDVWSPYPLSEAFNSLFGGKKEDTFVILLDCLNQWAFEIP